jgi:hypothetical protein
MIISGFFGGLINFLQSYKAESKDSILFWKCIIVGIGASFLVPLFLQTISSAIITTAEQNPKDYLIFGGFCLIAAIYSKRFIETLGEKILQKAEQAEKKAEEANFKAKELKIEVEKQSEEVDSIIAKSTEIDDPSVDNEPLDEESKLLQDLRKKADIDDSTDFISKTKNIISVIQALKNNNYTFRTLKGISKEIGLDQEETEEILNACEGRGLIRKIVNNNKVLYALTIVGVNFDKRLTEFNSKK